MQCDLCDEEAECFREEDGLMIPYCYDCLDELEAEEEAEAQRERLNRERIIQANNRRRPIVFGGVFGQRE